jgi:type II secretory pathway pseudopilin PulG
LVNAPPSQPVYTGPQQTDGKAVGSLILGILSFLAPILCSIPAVILGHISRSQIRKSMGRLKGEGMALAGLIMGYMSVAFIPILLIIAAIAIPNLLRSRMAANDSAAAQTIRTLVTNQIMYSTTYPEAGYAPDLATLGPGPGGSCTGASTAEHACLIDNVLGNSRCAAGTWCTRDAFNFTISATEGKPATNFVAAATPANANSGTRSYCATADGVVRSQRGLITTPPTVQECLAWESL